MLENTDLARGSWKRRRGLLGRRSQKMTVEVVVPTLRQVNARLKNAGARTVAVRGRDSQEQRPSPQIKSEVEEMYFLLQVSTSSVLLWCTVHWVCVCVFLGYDKSRSQSRRNHLGKRRPTSVSTDRLRYVPHQSPSRHP